ncbi:Pol Polyprotein [Phytophthora megakarya]|uniref:Pol Polyprotein n=1 Tax=Phytophthora megakarya TaxID=4795 RepID=A0A225WCP4_9STRA|nr:Pol Polyprotein [Phytophthora megakarya]
MLEKFGLAKATPVRVPIGGEDGDEDGELLPSDDRGSPQRPTVRTFQSLAGSLLWIARCTLPDIAYAIHCVTRHSHAPRENDWRLAKKITKYLKGTKDLKFRMGRDKDAGEHDGILVETYSDADYAADKADLMSRVIDDGGGVRGGITNNGGNAENSRAAKGDRCLIKPAAVLHVDNQAAIAQIEGEDASGRAKHIDVSTYSWFVTLLLPTNIDIYVLGEDVRAHVQRAEKLLARVTTTQSVIAAPAEYVLVLKSFFPCKKMVMFELEYGFGALRFFQMTIKLTRLSLIGAVSSLLFFYRRM